MWGCWCGVRVCGGWGALECALRHAGGGAGGAAALCLKFGWVVRCGMHSLPSWTRHMGRSCGEWCGRVGGMWGGEGKCTVCHAWVVVCEGLCGGKAAHPLLWMGVVGYAQTAEDHAPFQGLGWVGEVRWGWGTLGTQQSFPAGLRAA